MSRTIMSRTIWFAVSMLLMIVFSATVRADVIAAWEIDGLDVAADLTAPSFAFAATTTHANASGTLSLGSNNPTISNDQYGFRIPNADAQTTLDGAIANNHYLEFSVTIAPGFRLDLESIEMNGQSSGTGADDVALFTSIDGFADGDEIASLSGIAGTAGGFDTDGSGFGAPIVLSGIAYQGVTGTVSFRLYGFNTSGSTGVTHIRDLSGDDLIVNGTISSVPEPGSLALLTLAAGSCLAIRSRRYFG